MKRALKLVGLGLVVVAVAFAALLAVTFSGPSIPDGLRVGQVEVVKDGFVSSYVVALPDGGVALVDAGNDSSGKPILAALERRGLGAGSVRAILLTHGDWDHVAGVRAFPDATVMALQADVDLAEGRSLRGPLKSLRTPHPNGIRVGRALADGDAIDLGGVVARVFAVPGHTPGSAAYLLDGVLFLGDSADTTRDGGLAAGRWLFTSDPARNRASLAALAARLAPAAAEVRAIACSHSGVLTSGLEPLLAFGRAEGQ